MEQCTPIHRNTANNMAVHIHRSLKSRVALALMVVFVAVFVLIENHVAFPKLQLPLGSNTHKMAASSYPVTSPNTSHPLGSSLTSRQAASDSSSQCRNVLHNMLHGTWDQREMTPDEVQRMRLFHKRVREKEHHLPVGSQRADKRCGNVIVGSKGSQSFFRALCDPDGPTPCCYNSLCQNRTRQQCTCTNCQDMRTPLHAEYATWRPSNPSCRPRNWSVKDICRLLHNSTFHFIGDSLVRHVYTAFLLAARGNFLTGAMKPNVSDGLRSECSGLNMFSEKVCRRQLDRRTNVCNGSVQLELFEPCHARHVGTIHRAVLDLGNRTRSFVFMEVGLHDGFNFPLVQTRVLQPLLETMRFQGLTWPRLLWAGVHQFGLMKSPRIRENNAAVAAFNLKMKAFLGAYDVPVFDTFNLTRNVMSFDGTHFGYGVNAVKVNLLLHYIQELQSLGKW